MSIQFRDAKSFFLWIELPQETSHLIYRSREIDQIPLYFSDSLGSAKRIQENLFCLFQVYFFSNVFLGKKFPCLVYNFVGSIKNSVSWRNFDNHIGKECHLVTKWPTNVYLLCTLEKQKLWSFIPYSAFQKKLVMM